MNASDVRKDRRHRAREAALQILYQWEIGSGRRRTRRRDVLRAPVARRRNRRPTSSARLRRRWRATRSPRLDAIDPLIAETAERWRPERMAVIDRLDPAHGGLRAAARSETPPAVVINEALELARTFSTEEAVKFINGMLDAIRKKLRESKSRVTRKGHKRAKVSDLSHPY